jgi:hypothetical protein
MQKFLTCVIIDWLNEVTFFLLNLLFVSYIANY